MTAHPTSHGAGRARTSASAHGRRVLSRGVFVRLAVRAAGPQFGTETLTAGRKAGGVKLSNYAPGGGTTLGAAGMMMMIDDD